MEAVSSRPSRLTIPVELSGRHDCFTAGCGDSAEHCRLRRLADCYCVCGRVYGYGASLVHREATMRYYHAACSAAIDANPPAPLGAFSGGRYTRPAR